MKLWALVPELILGGLCLVLVPTAGWVRGRGRWIPAIASGLGLVGAIGACLWMRGWEPVSTFEGRYAVDGLATSMKLVLLTGSLVTLLFLVGHFRDALELPHAPIPMLFATLGAVGLVSSTDLGLLILFLQMTSMASYVFLVLVRRDRRSHEAALKYFVYAAVALAVMAYGLTFLYGMTGSLDLRVIGARLADGGDRAWIGLALVLILVGYGFEAAVVPFHMWAPDVFQGTTAPVAGFLSVVPKAAALAALARFLVQGLPGELVAWPWLVALVAVATMIFANLVALRQRHLKRLLAWSSIAQAGYVLVAIAVAERTADALTAMAFFLGVYVFMNLAAFGVVARLERAGTDDSFASVRGLARVAPGAATVLALALLSLAGLPPLAGFAAKVVIFEAAFAGGMGWLAAIAGAAMVVGLYYYVNVIAEMMLRRPPSPRRIPGHWGYTSGGALCIAALLLFGALPALGLDLVGAAPRLSW